MDVFRQSPPSWACLQAQLTSTNPRQSWSPAIRHRVFGSVRCHLPALEKLRLPSRWGTSNHFPRATLLEIGAWDRST